MGFPVHENATRYYELSVDYIIMQATLPIDAGDGLLVTFTLDPGITVTNWNGFTELLDEVRNNTRQIIAYKEADGTEPADSYINLSGSGKVNSISTRYQAATISPWGSIPPSIVTAQGTSVTADPPLLTAPWGTADNAWVLSLTANDVDPVDTYPTGYTTIFTSSTTGQRLQDLRYLNDAASSENPPAYSFDSSLDWLVSTIAIAPAGVGSGGGFGALGL